MEQPPNYHSILPPPTYEASIYAAQQEQESVWPRNYKRETPRTDVARFYHNLILTCSDEMNPSICYDDGDDQVLLPSPPSSPVSPSPSLLFDHHCTITELNQLLLQTWVKSDTVPSYEAFKSKIQSFDLRPIPNKRFQQS